MTATISKLRQLRNVGIFSNHVHGAATPDFRRYNLVYGFNGSGKTTLSRVFQSLGAEQLSIHLPEGGELTVELTDGTVIKADSLKSGISSRIVVFNLDFINDNLIWTSGSAKPVFYIGTAQGNALKHLQLLEKRVVPRNQAAAAAEKDCRARDREFSTLKAEIGKLVAEELSLGRRYNATNVETDYQSFDQLDARALTEDERKARKTLINRDAPPPNLIFNRPAPLASAAAIRDALATCSRSLGGIMIEALERHPGMAGWVKAGLDYHVGNALAECLHCGQPLTPDRVALLQASFDDSYEAHVREIQDSRTQIGNLMEALRAMSEALPAGELPADLAERFRTARADLQGAGNRCFAILRAIRLGLDEKGKAPNLAVAPALPEPPEGIGAIDQAIQEAISAIMEVIETHNMRNGRFAAEQADARKELKGHHLLEARTRYTALRASVQDASALRDVRSALAASLGRRVAEVRDRLRSHGPAVETINKLLKAFLGHGELALSSDGEGYRIQRRGRNAVGPLSEGERTAVAFCYYLTKLEEDGRKRKDVIAIVDDPISSLDTKALNYAFGLLKRTLTEASQLIVLTHNMDFMNEAKKWLKVKAYPREPEKTPEASMFFLATTVSPCGTIRSSQISELPRLLRDYDSEYQYLFSIVQLFNEGHAEEFAYLMPNAMRKVLEVFLAFKCPGTNGVESKLEQGTVRDCGIDHASLTALGRLSNVESHGDSLNDLIALPTMTIEESRSAAACLFQLIETLDPAHFKGMKAISKKANKLSAPASMPIVAATDAGQPQTDGSVGMEASELAAAVQKS